jgi:hypothetical protein
VGTAADVHTGAISEIHDAEQLVRYAVNVQIGQLPGSQNDWARDAGIGHLSELCSDHGTRKFTLEQLAKLDRLIQAKDKAAVHTDGLASFAAKLRANSSGIGSVEAPLTPGMLKVSLPDDAPGAAEVALLQGAALVELFSTKGNGELAQSETYARHLTAVVDRLLHIGVSPPTPRSIEALLMIGNLARHAFAPIEDRLDQALARPLGFRVWRAYSTIVRLTTDMPASDARARYISERVRLQLSRCVRLRKNSLYPARSLDLELALSVPRQWTPPADDWAGKVLHDRARNHEATVRERAMAAVGLWERALGHPEQDETQQTLDVLIEDFENDKTEVREGLQWAAAMLHQNIERREPVCNDWPSPPGHLGEQIKLVIDATKNLAVPGGLQTNPANDDNINQGRERLRAATQFLIQQALLQSAGVYRRRAVDTLRAARWGSTAVEVFASIASNDEASPWLRSRSLFAIGFLVDRDPLVHRVLYEACNTSWERLMNSERKDHTRDLVSEMHAALFAVGDCFGAVEAEEQAKPLRRHLQPLVEEAVELRPDDERMRSVSRALCYMVAFTGWPGDESSEDVLNKLSTHTDTTTQDLSRWALARRFRPSP